MDRIGRRARWAGWILAGFCLLALASVFAVITGPAALSFSEAVRIILGRIPFLEELLRPGELPDTYHRIVWELRMPRVLLAGMVGGALGVVGGVFQGFFRNPMADPFVIGVSSGAALGATMVLVSGYSALLGLFTVPLAGFVSALLTTWLVYRLARVGSKVVVPTLLLAGIALSSFLQSMISFLMVMNAEEMDKVYFWLMGSFANRSWSHVLMAAPLILLGSALLMVFSRDLNALAFGDSTAAHLGIDLEKLKILLLVLASLTAAGAVSVSGIIGFVGLIIPHIVRMLVGPDHRILLPVSYLGGGIFLVLADTAARILVAPVEIPIGTITALFGGPYFIYLLRRKKENVF